MFEQDYIMRQIKELVRALLKLLFHLDTDSPALELLEQSTEREQKETVLDLVDAGRINEAENLVYDADLETALLFYSYVNEKSDEFLEANEFSRKEVLQGLKDCISRYGLDGITEIFLE